MVISSLPARGPRHDLVAPSAHDPRPPARRALRAHPGGLPPRRPQLADHFHTPPDRLTEPQLRDYFLHLKNDRHFAAASLGIAYSGIKFFYSHTIPRDWPTLKRLRVPREKRLPDVLSIDEVRRLIAAVRTPHNRTYFQTVYSLGLRLGEGLHLQVGDIDSARMMVHVHRGKGAKDRFVPLPSTHAEGPPRILGHPSPSDLAVPRHRPRSPPGRRRRRPMERSSVQGALRRVVRDLGLRKADLDPHITT